MANVSVKVALPSLLFLRFLLFFSPLPEILQNDQQLTSPLTSYSRLREGVYLFNQGFNPYAGGGFRQSPILLALFSTVLPLSNLTSAIVWTAADGIAAWSMAQIWRARSKGDPTAKSRETLIVALYLLNPYLFLPNLARSTASIDNALTLLAIMFASRGWSSPAFLSMAAAIHLSLTNILLAPPLLLLLLRTSRAARPAKEVSNTSSTNKSLFPRSVALVSELFVHVGILALISTLVADGWIWVNQTWGTSLFLPDFTPNPGLWWYFFTEMFDHFRPFFLMAFSVHLLIYVAPVCIKFSHDPLYAIFVLQGILATFKPYPTLADPGLFASMFTLFPEVFQYFRHPIVTVLLHMHAALLLPLFNSLWLSQGTGNANFYYAVTLVFGLAMAATVNDAVWAGLRVQFGPKQEGWEMVQT